MTMRVVYLKNGRKVTASDIRVSVTADEQARENLTLRSGWSKYCNCMNRQIELILDTDWVNAFQNQSFAFGKVDAAFVIRKAFGALRPAI